MNSLAQLFTRAAEAADALDEAQRAALDASYREDEKRKVLHDVRSELFEKIDSEIGKLRRTEDRSVPASVPTP